METIGCWLTGRVARAAAARRLPSPPRACCLIEPRLLLLLPMRCLVGFTCLAYVPTIQAIDNGIGLTPPRGWRSWNLFHGDINTTVMENQMRAVLDKSRSVNGKPGGTLASLGFNWISMDDGWQRCNCSQHGADPGKPTCPPNCKEGGCSWHDVEGKPVVDVDYGHSLGLKVGSYLNNCICMEGGDPPMGRNCIGQPHYQEDVDFIIATGFDGVKIDNCGASHNVTLWAELFNKTGKPIRIESCHTFHPNHGTPSSWPNFPVWDPATKAADAQCPMNLYRTGGDIGPAFSSCIGEAYATVQYNDRPDPFSHPGCWAYPDMQEIGNYKGADPLRTDEEKTHWGLWCIISAPLILGSDLSDQTTMDRIWGTISNTEALAVNDAWAGQPGTLVRSYPSTNPASPMMVDQAPCDGSPETTGWSIQDGKLQAPSSATASAATIAATGQRQCLGTKGGPTGQSDNGMISCPPPTTQCHRSPAAAAAAAATTSSSSGSAKQPCPGCGLLLTNCSQAPGVWSLQPSHGNDPSLMVLQWNATTTTSAAAAAAEHGSLASLSVSLQPAPAHDLSFDAPFGSSPHGTVSYDDTDTDTDTDTDWQAPPQKAKCLQAKPSSGVGGFYGGPKAALTSLGNCPGGGRVANTSTFTMSATGEIKAGTGMCLAARKLFGPQLWSKPLGNGSVAILVINIAPEDQDFSLPLVDVPELACATAANDGSGAGCSVRDVWQQKDLPTATSHLRMMLREHESEFFVLSPAADK